MKHSLVKDEMTLLLENINEQFDMMNQHENRIPQIEIDLFMRNIQKLYENSIYLNKYNSKPEQENTQNKETVVEKYPEQIQAIEVDRVQKRELEDKQNLKPEFIEEVEDPVAAISAHMDELPAQEKKLKVIEEAQDKPAHMVKDEVVEAPMVQEILVEDIAKRVDQAVPEKEKLTETHSDIAIKAKIEMQSVEFSDILEEKEEELNLFTDIKVNDEISDLNKKLAEARNTQSIVEKLQSKRIDSLKSVIGINDKFYFINELFAGNSQKYEDIIYTLNNFKKLEDAMVYFSTLKYKFSWDEESDAYIKLSQMLERKFELVNA
jgi:hypothetical protein